MNTRSLHVVPPVVSNPTRDAETATLQHIDELVEKQRSLGSGTSIERAARSDSTASERARLQLLIDSKWEELRRQRSVRQRSSDARALIDPRRHDAPRSAIEPQQPPVLVSALASPEPSTRNPSPDAATLDEKIGGSTRRRRGSWWITMALLLVLKWAS